MTILNELCRHSDEKRPPKISPRRSQSLNYDVLRVVRPRLIALFRALTFRVDAFVLTSLNIFGPAFFAMRRSVPFVDSKRGLG